MKKIFLTAFLLLTNSFLFGQSLPQYYIVNGDTTGIILSIDQVKKIKNDLELKIILEDMKISCDSSINKYIIVVDDYEKQVVSLKATISKMDTSVANKTKTIDKINKTLQTVERDRNLCDSASAKKDTVISNSNIIISDLKCKRNLGYGGTVLFLITTVLLLLF